MVTSPSLPYHLLHPSSLNHPIATASLSSSLTQEGASLAAECSDHLPYTHLSGVGTLQMSPGGKLLPGGEGRTCQLQSSREVPTLQASLGLAVADLDFLTARRSSGITHFQGGADVACPYKEARWFILRQ